MGESRKLLRSGHCATKGHKPSGRVIQSQPGLHSLSFVVRIGRVKRRRRTADLILAFNTAPGTAKSTSVCLCLCLCLGLTVEGLRDRCAAPSDTNHGNCHASLIRSSPSAHILHLFPFLFLLLLDLFFSSVTSTAEPVNKQAAQSYQPSTVLATLVLPS